MSCSCDMAEPVDVTDCEDVLQEFLLHDIKVSGRELGVGSYSSVLELEYKGLKCAGKRIHRDLYEQGIAIGPEILERFGNECELLSQLRHPRIVQFLGLHFEEDADVPILVLEYMPGALSECIERHGELPDEISYSILHDVAIGLHYLHEHKPPIIHRDLTANNVLLTTNMSAKISDLGMAKILNLPPAQMARRMTVCPGTISYMPPEALTADPLYDTKLDSFSFGILMIHIFCGEWPLATEYLQPDPDHPGHLKPLTELERREKYLKRLTPGHPLLELIQRCLRNIPSERPSTLEILDRVSHVASNFPASFDNRLEMLKRINSDSKEKSQLTEEVANLKLLLHEKKHELENLRLRGKAEMEALKEKITILEQTQAIQTVQIAELQEENAHFQHVLEESQEEVENERKRNDSLRRELQSKGRLLRERTEEMAKRLQQLQTDVMSRSEEREKALHSLTRTHLDLALEHTLSGRSTSELTQDYEDFFLGAADEAVEAMRWVPGISHFQAQRLVCEMVEQSYHACKAHILTSMNRLLEELFTIEDECGEPRGSEALHDVRVAYGLLLRAGKMIDSTHHKSISQQILKNFLKKDRLHQASRLIHTSLQTHLGQTCRLAWVLLTTSPPLILAKPPRFRDDWLDREFEYWDKRTRSSKLYYTRPVLFRSYEGAVGVKGWVGNSLESAQQTPARNSRTRGL